MSKLPLRQLRNVALVGHHGAGKTTLAEALLASSGAVERPGSVERGTTTLDFEREETEREMSLSLAVASLDVDDVRVNIIDTPGYPDFSFEMLSGLSVADLAVIVVSATEGVQAQTQDAWRMAEELGLARIVVVNKLDKDRSDFQSSLDQIRSTFGAGVAPVELPIGSSRDFRGVIDLLDDTATIYDIDAVSNSNSQAFPIGKQGPIPEALVDSEHEIHDQLIEGIVVGDEALMERYLADDRISKDELQHALAGGVASSLVFPVICASASTGVGVDRLARLLVELSPSPSERGVVTLEVDDAPREVVCDPGGAPVAVAFKTISEVHSGPITACKVLAGTLRPETALVNTKNGTEERIHGIFSLQGRTTTPTDQAIPGDIIALTRLCGTATGDVLVSKGTPAYLNPLRPEPPPLRIAVVPSSRADDDKLMSALQRLCDEDPQLGVERVDETHQTVLGVTGEIHFSVTLQRLSRKFGVNVEREELTIPYRETISRPAQAEGKHKKQSGGHGQFGVCHLRVEPLERGAGFEFHDEIVGGAIPRQYIPGVEKGVIEVMESSGPLGFPVVDISVTCDDGKYHPVDSNELSFKSAAAVALREALSNAGPLLLEPVSRVEVVVPSAAQGDVLADLNSRRARILGSEPTDDGYLTLHALVPSGEITRYAVDLRSLTGARGKFRSEYDHYEPVPEHLVQSLLESSSRR